MKTLSCVVIDRIRGRKCAISGATAQIPDLVEIELLACEAMPSSARSRNKTRLKSGNGRVFRFGDSRDREAGQTTMSLPFLKCRRFRWPGCALDSSRADLVRHSPITTFPFNSLNRPNPGGRFEAIAQRDCRAGAPLQNDADDRRSHGVHAEPITFGLKLALMFDEIRPGEERLAQTLERIRVGKNSAGAVAPTHTSSKVERAVCEKIGIEASHSVDADVQRDRHAEFDTALAVIVPASIAGQRSFVIATNRSPRS